VAKKIEGTILVVVDVVVVVLVADEVVLVEILEETFPEIPTLGVLIVRFRVMLSHTAIPNTRIQLQI
jgi:hypothetical protein